MDDFPIERRCAPKVCRVGNDWHMSPVHPQVSLRPYHESEFARVCAIREITIPEKIERFRDRFMLSGQWFDHYLHLAIEADGELVGDMQLRHCNFTMPDGALEMGLELGHEFRGKGIGTGALEAVAQYAFAQGHHRVEGSTANENIGMKRAFEKAGWKFEGILHDLFVEDGKPADYYSYAITKFDC